MKIKYFLLILPLFFFFSTNEVQAATTSDFMQNKEDYELATNVYSNLNLSSDFLNYYNFFKAYIAQRTTTDDLDYDSWEEVYSNAHGLKMNDVQNLYGSDSNISSFFYGGYWDLRIPIESNKKYEFTWIISTSKEVDYYKMYEATEDFSIQYWDSTSKSYKDVASTKRFLFYREENSDSDAVHYWLTFQFIPEVDLNKFYITLGDKDNPFDSSTIKYLDNLTNKTINISLVQERFFEVDEFTFSSGVIHGGGGMTFDGERTDDSSFDNVYESCDRLDFVCHFRNVKNWFLTLGRRISNGFESILDFFKGIGEFLIDLFKSLFVPSEEFLSSRIDGLKTFISEKLGIIVYPIELLFDILDRLVNIPESNNTVINIPEVKLLGKTLIQPQSFSITQNWNSEPFSTIYNIYLTFVNFFIGFCIYKLCCKKYAEIIGGSAS